MSFIDAVRRARASGSLEPLVEAIPYAEFMGISMSLANGRVIGELAFSEHLIGNAKIRALHGGALGALLESTAIFELLWRAESLSVPKTINITVQYLRSGKPQDTFARADITREGRRIVNVQSVAWQGDRDKPIAAATAHFLLAPAEKD